MKYFLSFDTRLKDPHLVALGHNSLNYEYHSWLDSDFVGYDVENKSLITSG